MSKRILCCLSLALLSGLLTGCGANGLGPPPLGTSNIADALSVLSESETDAGVAEATASPPFVANCAFAGGALLSPALYSEELGLLAAGQRTFATAPCGVMSRERLDTTCVQAIAAHVHAACDVMLETDLAARAGTPGCAIFSETMAFSAEELEPQSGTVRSVQAIPTLAKVAGVPVGAGAVRVHTRQLSTDTVFPCAVRAVPAMALEADAAN